jgi:general stress protein YciG
MTDQKPKSRRGFAAMPRELMLEISAKGGKGTPPEKRTFALDSTLAKDSARLGGLAKAAKSKVPD